jgi:DNA-directed RNA polymerase subunit H (RpoH/RPB5)
MLPQIKISDPVARFLGMQAGQVARITRTTRGNATCVTYRIVVAPEIL